MISAHKTPKRKLTIGRTARVVIGAGALALTLGGCASKMRGADIQAEIPDNYEERHPIVLGDVSQTLDVFLVPSSGIDFRQAEDVRAFVKSFRANGKGAMVVALPPGAPPVAVSHTLKEIRRVAGLGGMQVINGPTHPTAAAVRLSYAALDTKVVSKCGQWPYDMAGGTTTQGWTNRPYYNLGCSYQSMLAAQAANPIDHVRPRQEGPYDMERRLKDIKDVRDNKDPSTKWPTETSKISTAVQ